MFPELADYDPHQIVLSVETASTEDRASTDDGASSDDGASTEDETFTEDEASTEDGKAARRMVKLSNLTYIDTVSELPNGGVIYITVVGKPNVTPPSACFSADAPPPDKGSRFFTGKILKFGFRSRSPTPTPEVRKLVTGWRDNVVEPVKE